MIIVHTREDFLKEAKAYLPEFQLYCAEIGVYRGDFSDLILKIMSPYLLYLIDPFITSGERYGKELNNIQTAYSNYRDYDYVKQRFFRFANVVIKRDFSFNAVREFRDEQFHLIYHDASHLYEDLKLDLNMWVGKLHFSGLMCGHDYGNEIFPGVKKVVDEFCEEHDFEMIIFNDNGGDWALKRKQ